MKGIERLKVACYEESSENWVDYRLYGGCTGVKYPRVTFTFGTWRLFVLTERRLLTSSWQKKMQIVVSPDFIEWQTTAYTSRSQLN